MTALTAPIFALLGSLVEERAGLHYMTSDLPLFADKISGRLLEAGFDSPLDYYYFLRYDPRGDAELDALLDALVVGETYLFRELDALTVGIEHVVRPAIAARGRARIWSAGCSTGEEPFSLAMLLADAGLGDRVDIVATDVSKRSLARARAAALTQRSLRMLSSDVSVIPSSVRALSQKWLERTPTGARVSSEIVDKITFRHDTLLDSAAVLRDFDFILCRNVLIYFRDDVVRQVVDTFAGRLAPDGRLAVGASESLMRFGTMLKCEERAGSFFYVRETR